MPVRADCLLSIRLSFWLTSSPATFPGGSLRRASVHKCRSQPLRVNRGRQGVHGSPARCGTCKALPNRVGYYRSGSVAGMCDLPFPGGQEGADERWRRDDLRGSTRNCRDGSGGGRALSHPIDRGTDAIRLPGNRHSRAIRLVHLPVRQRQQGELLQDPSRPSPGQGEDRGGGSSGSHLQGS